jgi:hypothetical protein
MLKAIAAGVSVGVAPKIRQDEQRGVARVLRLGLNGFPQIGAEAIGATNAINI